MKLHFDEPVDKTRENSAIFEFFSENDDDRVMNITKIKGKSLARMIEERKISKYYNKKKHITLELKLLQIFVVLASVICVGMIIYLITKIV